MTDQVGKIEQTIKEIARHACKHVDEAWYSLAQQCAENAAATAYEAAMQRVMDQNKTIRELENEKIALLDQLADAGMEIKRLREAVREAERVILARIREKGYVIVPKEPTPDRLRAGNEAMLARYANQHAAVRETYLVMTAIDQDEIEREVMK